MRRQDRCAGRQHGAEPRSHGEQRLGATGEPHSGQAGRIQETALPVRAQGE